MSLDIDDIERLLRARRVTPRAEFVGALERSLLRASASRPDGRRVRCWSPDLGSPLVLAPSTTLLAVTGLLPFTSSARRAHAGEDCRITRVEGMQRHPHLVRDGDGKFQVRYRVERPPRLVRRCR